MARMQVYLPDSLHRLLKARGLPASELVQKAVRAELRRLELLAETERYVGDLVAEVGPPEAEQRKRADAFVRRPARRKLLLALLAVCCLAVAASCASTKGWVTTTTGLKYRIVESGSGPAAKPGQSVRIHETTTLEDGTLIYSTRTADKPLKFLLGGNQVIAGVDEGVTGMRVGERRKLVVPPSLSWRSSYPANTPPDAVLYYDVELVEIVSE